MEALSDQSRTRSTSLGKPSLSTFVIYDFWQKTGLYPGGDLSWNDETENGWSSAGIGS